MVHMHTYTYLHIHPHVHTEIKEKMTVEYEATQIWESIIIIYKKNHAENI